MVEIIRRNIWSKSTAFLLPLTGIKKTRDFEIRSYLYWNDYSIGNFELAVKVEYGHKFQEFLEFMHEGVFKNRNSLIREVFEYEGFSVFIFDISDWAEDVAVFMEGKYSKLSKPAKVKIQKYNSDDNNNMPISIYCCLFPDEPHEMLGNMTPLEYAVQHYITEYKPNKADYESAEIWQKSGELCSIFDMKEETLVLEECQDGVTL
jgi:hypothetical protein